MKQKLLKLMCLLCVGVISASAWATDFTLSSANSVTKDGITVSFDKGDGGTAPTWYAAGLRLYAKNTVTITSTNTITGITFNWEKQGSKAFASVTASGGTYSHPANAGDGTWTGSATSVTFTLGTSGQLQLNTLSVTVSGGGSPAVETTTTIITSGITNTDVYVGTAAGSLSASVTEAESGDAVDGATVTWSGNNDAVATINASTGAVTLVGEGTVTFTVTYAGDASYNSSSNTYKMTVVDNTPVTAIAILSVYSGTTYAMTTTVDKTAGAVEVQVIDGKVVANPADVASITWYIRPVSGGYAIKNASGKYLTNSSTELSLSDSPQTWTLDASNQLLSGTRGLLYRDAQSGFRAYATSNAGNSDYGTVGVKYEEFAYTRSTAAGNWGTICLPYDATVTGAKLYSIVGKEITGSEVTALLLDEVASIEAGKPYIFKATADNVVATYTGTTYTDAGAVNGLYGTYSAIAAGEWDGYVPGDLYLLTTSNVQAANKATSSLAANRAYIVLSEVNNIGSPVKGVRLGFEEATGITELTEKTEATEGVIYNLNGQRVNGVQKGINIVNGKKILVK